MFLLSIESFHHVVLLYFRDVRLKKVQLLMMEDAVPCGRRRERG